MPNNIVIIEKNPIKFEKYFSVDLLLILKTLVNNNKQALIVGGAVRDYLFGHDPKDFDISTDATPAELVTIFKDYKLLTIGYNYGTLTIIINKKPYDISTFRKEHFPVWGKPPVVTYVRTIDEDLKRRDLTINAIFYDFTTRTIKATVEAINDINNRRLTILGKISTQLREDGLRVLRIARFMSKYDLMLDERLKEEIFKIGSTSRYRNMDAARIEFFKLLQLDNPVKGLKLLIESKIIFSLFPEETTNNQQDYDDCLIKNITRLPNNPWIRLYTLYRILLSEDKIEMAAKKLNLTKKHQQRLLRFLLGEKKFNYYLKKDQLKRWVRAVGINSSLLLLEYLFIKANCTNNKELLSKENEIRKKVILGRNMLLRPKSVKK